MSAETDRIAELEAEVARLEAANDELRRVNARLAAAPGAKIDAAAASALASRERAAVGPVRRLRTRARAGLRAVALRILR
jgi:hypothetical protein